MTGAVLSLYLAALESDGDKKQFRELYRRYHRVMERTALAVLHDPHDAEEAVQEAFLRVIENFSKIDEIPCKDLGGWLVIIVRNEAITILRRRRCHLPLEEGWADFAGQSRDLPDYSSMVQLFARLPDTYRAVLEMKLVLGWSSAEIARRLGLTESAVNTRLSRGRALLRKIFEEEGDRTMTDQELDRMLRRALLDAADQEAQTPPETETPLSEGHRRRMREMLRDPLLWFRLRNPYPWRTVARRAAVVLLMLSLSAAMVLAVSPKARADIIRWTMEQDGRRVEFRYHGDGPAQALPQYRIAALPEGYTETERIAYDSFGSVRYENAEGNAIELDYMYMQDGVSSGYTLADGDVKREVSISGMPGMLLISTEEGRLSYITWMDAAQNISFQIIADADESVIITMAESVFLCNSTN